MKYECNRKTIVVFWGKMLFHALTKNILYVNQVVSGYFWYFQLVTLIYDFMYVVVCFYFGHEYVTNVANLCT